MKLLASLTGALIIAGVASAAIAEPNPVPSPAPAIPSQPAGDKQETPGEKGQAPAPQPAPPAPTTPEK